MAYIPKDNKDQNLKLEDLINQNKELSENLRKNENKLMELIQKYRVLEDECNVLYHEKEYIRKEYKDYKENISQENLKKISEKDNEIENYLKQIQQNQLDISKSKVKINELSVKLKQNELIIKNDEKEISDLKQKNNQKEKEFKLQIEFLKVQYKKTYEEELKKLRKGLVKQIRDKLSEEKRKFSELYSQQDNKYNFKFNELEKNLLIKKSNDKNNDIIKDLESENNELKKELDKMEYNSSCELSYWKEKVKEIEELKKTICKMREENKRTNKKYDDELKELNYLKENNKIKDIIIESNKKGINKLKEYINNLDKEQEEHYNKLIITNQKYNLSENENLINLIIMTEDEKVLFPLICKDANKFIIVEEKFYEEFPEYLEKKGKFFWTNILLDKDKTLKDYKIKNNNIIIFKEDNKI